MELGRTKIELGRTQREFGRMLESISVSGVDFAGLPSGPSLPILLVYWPF